MNGTWLVEFRHSRGAIWDYVVPSSEAATVEDARAAATARHDETLRRYGYPNAWRNITLTSVQFRPEICCRERAAAWVALREAGALYPGGGWRSLSASGSSSQWENRDEAWRRELRHLHLKLRATTIGHGRTIQEVLQGLAGTPQGWDLAPYTSADGHIHWGALLGDIRKAATTEVWRTPYGVLWTEIS
ncbi:hypothetical protein [Streptomyces abikoensis]